MSGRGRGRGGWGWRGRGRGGSSANVVEVAKAANKQASASKQSLLREEPINWHKYFPNMDSNDDPHADAAILKETEAWKEVFRGKLSHLVPKSLPRDEVVKLDYAYLTSVVAGGEIEEPRSAASSSSSSSFIDLEEREPIRLTEDEATPLQPTLHAFQDNWELALSILSYAMYRSCLEQEDEEPDCWMGKTVQVRMENFTPLTPMTKIKQQLTGKFISITGRVIRVSAIRFSLTEITSTCVKCRAEYQRTCVDGRYEAPAVCSTKGCNSKVFEADRDSAITIDFQKIRLQEIIKDDDKEPGRMPKVVDVELTRDLVGTCVSGDEITVSGALHAITAEADQSKRARETGSVFLLLLDANSLVNNTSQRSRKQTSRNADDVRAQFSSKQWEFLEYLKTEPKDSIFHLIVNSLCPDIFGYEAVKAGLALALFGGSGRPAVNIMDSSLGVDSSSSANQMVMRGDPHILIVGDPGMGKSQMLTAVSKLVPRSVYVSGNATTTAGLTVAIVRDASGEYAFEAGALVLSDQGVCCIDEFDKMGAEHQGLLECMEQQTISIAKAGLVCSLPARTSIIAAANPIGGHFDRGRTVGENIKISAPLMSRFDLIFVLYDDPDEQKDRKLTEHFVKMHSKLDMNESQRAKSQRGAGGASSSSSSSPGKHGEDLLKRLAERPEGFDPLPPKLVRAVLQYARQHIKPVYSPEAAHIFTNFYTELRKHSKADSTKPPLTMRQLESLYRLGQARARVTLEAVVTEQHALEVVQIVQESMYQTMTDSSGMIDLRPKSTVRGKGNELTQFVERLISVARKYEGNILQTSEIREMWKAFGGKLEFDQMLGKLEWEGSLLKQAGSKFKVFGAS